MRFILSIAILFISCSVLAQDLRIPVTDSIVYDFGGATRKGSPGLYKYFTFNTSDDGRITRAITDFNRDSLGGHGWKGLINLQREYTLKTDSAVVFYDPSGSVDTIDLYMFDKDNAPKWDTIVNTHNYTPTYHIVSCGTCSGLPITTVKTSPAGRKVQFILVVVHRTNLFSGLWPDIRAITFRGTATGNQDTTYNMAQWAYTGWTAKPIDSIVGNFNLQNQQDTLWHDTATGNGNHAYFRSFDQMFFDNENVAFPANRMDLGGGGYTAYKYNAALARRGNFQFAAVFGDNAYFQAQEIALHGSYTRSWGTNTPADDPRLPASYSRKGRYMHGLAWIGGGCAGCASVPTYNGTPVPGQGYLKGLGTSNEPTLFAFANAWKSPIEVAAEAIGVVDSVKLGDPNMPVFLAGFEAYNYDDAKAAIILMKLWYRSRNIHIDGVAFHGIHTLKTDSFAVTPTSNQQIGNHGISVGYWDDWRKEIRYVQGMRREAGNPNLLVQLDEDGHQKGVYKRKPNDVGETFTVSQLGTPRFTVAGSTLDAYKSHGVAALQDVMITTASPVYKHYWYTLVDDVLSTTNPDYDAIDGNNGLFDRPATCCTERPEAWPAHFALSSFKHRFGRYRFIDSVTTVSRGLHVFKYVNVSNPDSLLFIYAVLDSVSTATVNLTGLSAASGKIITPSFVSNTPTETTGTITGGAISLSADPMPRGFIVYSPGGNVAPNADAGADQSITLPTASVSLSGSGSTDSDGTITGYLWTKISGPASFNIVSPTSVTTTVNTLVAGVYVFQLQVTDNGSLTDTDTIQITVNSGASFIEIKRHIKVYN